MAATNKTPLMLAIFSVGNNLINNFVTNRNLAEFGGSSARIHFHYQFDGSFQGFARNLILRTKINQKDRINNDFRRNS